MFATNRRFAIRDGRMVTGVTQSPTTPEVALTHMRKPPSSEGKKETASLFGQGLGGNLGQSSMSILGSGPLSTTTLLSGLVPENEALLNVYYRDIYYHDSVAGAVVDMISTFPFSDFSLMGIEDNKTLDKYEESVARLNVRSLMPQISLCYLVDGKFVGTFVFNSLEKVFYDIIIHSADSCVIDELPLFSTDPIITVSSNQVLANFMNSPEPQAQLLRQMLGPKLTQALTSSRFKLDPLSTLYLARRTLPNREPTSFLKRILPIYLLEKMLYRGTLVEAARRQRAMLHITMGDDTWEPTPQEMMSTVLQFQQADLDPLGAVIATRNGVQVSEVRQGGDFWKWSDTSDMLTPLKLRALGTSEAFLSGDSNYSNTETAMSVFMENIDAYRSFQTHKVFDSKVFPIVAVTNGFFKDKNRAGSISNADKAKLLYKANNQNDLLMPTLRWHKTLKAKDETDVFAAMDYMAEKGIPVPLRMIFAACKVDPNDLWQDLQQDSLIKERLSKVTGVSADEIAPGGDAGGENVGEFASLLHASGINRVPLASRDFGEQGEVTGTSKTGQKKYIHNQRKANTEINQQIVKAFARLSSDPGYRKKLTEDVAKRLGREPNMGLVPSKGKGR